MFAVAALTKLADREGTRKAVGEFGAPEWSAGALALLLPLAELTVAGLLLFPETAAYGAIGALVLLAIFSVAIGVSLARGRAPDCHCFGQLHSAPASWKTLARNGVLAALAVVSFAGNLTDDQASAFAWLGDLEGAELLAVVVAVVAVGIIVIGGTAFLTLMRSYGQVLTRLDRVEAALASAGYELDDEPLPEIGLAPGTPAPAFSARTLSGDPVSLEPYLESGLPAVLLFTSPNCGPCSALMPTVAGWQRHLAESLSIVLVSDGAADEVSAEAAEHELANILLDDGHATYEAYEANGTPSAVVIAPDGTIGSWVVAGSEWIERLVEQTAAGDDEAAWAFQSGPRSRCSSCPRWRAKRFRCNRCAATKRCSSSGTRTAASAARCTKTCSPGRRRRTASLLVSSSSRPETRTARGRRASARSSCSTRASRLAPRSAPTARRWQCSSARMDGSPPRSSPARKR